ncbi:MULTISPECIES: oxidoreductase [unclassified Pseudomonas]|uniref:oxidoreductase n=1 Tax=unclassified Pseudomonas TaxID=196821 RepID=UPI000BD6A6D2|nr:MULTISPECIES: oxidoreductase [unclassified Pseudomonas]PVZ19488.1 short-subunit dehydrogenase [Pseudomonas sp. URIL14HWK12:I12]PVZ22927.1 short-subunit dehydrogenase [Pseudomonas sp. URIL14HWK12:I10]PVZ37443.1 short-subunit dehydrogenase [Pseudomonas sp. URIL14HWK12:I11]SNZ14799.1 Short-chain dehydrogenase [Pseudomonas sp. URIL14HWK12:I9]
MTNKTFLITGVSSGLGRALAVAALEAGHRVIGTVRQPAALNAFEALSPGRAQGVMLDVSCIDRVGPVLEETIARTGRVDVLVNNAGYGHEGLFEESPLEQMRQQFEVNVFGAVAVMQALVPHFRQQRGGHILNITSMGGTITMPGVGYYCASKFALEGITATLRQELAPFGVKVTAVAPGSFRTDWAGRSMKRSPRSISDYDRLFDPIRQARQDKSGKQLGDPAKAALAILHIVEAPEPPAQILLGSDALGLVRTHLHQRLAEIDQWQALTRSTDG